MPCPIACLSCCHSAFDFQAVEFEELENLFADDLETQKHSAVLAGFDLVFAVAIAFDSREFETGDFQFYSCSLTLTLKVLLIVVA
jgi:hypothetical protein